MINHEENACATLPCAETIARLNDQLRKSGTGGMIVMTGGVMNLAGFNTLALTGALAGFQAFDADNDPHGERDLGDLQLFGADLLWKIDYYDQDLAYASPDPSDAAATRRVLTVMLAEEY